MFNRTATRATLALFPLFGLTGILFSIEPKGSTTTVLAYRIVNALVQTSQVRVDIGVREYLTYKYFKRIFST